MNLKKKRNIWISDLTHTEQGIVSRVFPLGAGSIYSYAKQELGNEFNFRLFKFPSNLNDFPLYLFDINLNNLPDAGHL